MLVQMYQIRSDIMAQRQQNNIWRMLLKVSYMYLHKLRSRLTLLSTIKYSLWFCHTINDIIAETWLLTFQKYGVMICWLPVSNIAVKLLSSHFTVLSHFTFPALFFILQEMSNNFSVFHFFYLSHVLFSKLYMHAVKIFCRSSYPQAPVESPLPALLYVASFCR